MKVQRYSPYGRHMYYKQRKSGKKKVVIIILAAVVVACAVGFAGFMFFKPKPETVNSVTVTKTTDKTISLKWNKPEKADSYCVYWKPKNKDYKKADKIKDNTYTIRNLNQASEYTVCVSACYDKEESDKSEEQKAHTIAEKPKITEAVSESKGQIKIKWEKNPKADSYKVQYKEAAAEKYTENNTIKVKRSEPCEAVIENLIEKATYDLRVCTVTKNGKTYSDGMWNSVKLSVRRQQRELDPNKPMVAFTFDDGPSYGTANERILNVLEKYDVRATFFMVGTNVVQHPENVKRKAALGMELGNHTWSHKRFGKKVTASDIKKCSDAIKEITGQYPTAFRSPGGMTTDAIQKECAKENMSLYRWNVDTQDWQSGSAKSICKNVLKTLKDGNIILMHEIYDTTADAIEQLVPKLIKEGYQIVSCEELIKYKRGEDPEAGKEYFSAHE